MKFSASLAIALLAAAVGAAGGYWYGLRTQSDADAERVMAGAAALASTKAPGEIPAHGNTNALFSATLDDLRGQSVKLASYKGKTLIVNFWASWCPPCIAEMPDLSRFYTDHASNRIQMLGIAIDNPTAVRGFLKDHPVSYPVLFGGMSGAALSTELGDAQGGLPFTVVIDGQGRVVYQHLGQTSYDALQTIVSANP
jgi:thiol-disulfide isomerase/thioredoxin